MPILEVKCKAHKEMEACVYLAEKVYHCQGLSTAWHKDALSAQTYGLSKAA